MPVADLKEDHIENTVKGLKVITKQGNDLMGFVQSYRSLLSVPEPDKEIIGAFQLMKKVALLLGGDLERNGISLNIHCEPEHLELFVDEKLLTQVLLNLCKNAAQALKETSDPRISMMAGQNEDGKKYVEVRDNGPGIPKELMEEIFVPFFTTNSSGVLSHICRTMSSCFW